MTNTAALYFARRGTIRNMNRFVRVLSVLGGTVWLAGCSSVNVDEVLPDKSVEYKRETQAGRNLEVPPDLTSGRVNDRMSVPDNFSGVPTNYSEYVTDQKIRGTNGGVRASSGLVLAKSPNIEVKRDGDARWLVVEGPAEQIWDRVIAFWQDNGILLEEQDPSVGVMRTSWLENRATISRDLITDTIRRAFDGLYETGTRDQYRVRFEQADTNHTEIYMTHFGMEEKLVGSGADKGDSTVWTTRPRDPGLEGVMLRRMMVFLGAAEERATAQLKADAKRQKTRSQLIKGRDGAKLVISEEFSRSWRLVGLALDRVGFAVEDRDRSAGVYYVRYSDPAADTEQGGILSSLKFWGDEKTDKKTQYQIKVALDGNNTAVTVLNEKGAPDQSNTGKRILSLLKEQIR